MKPKVSVHYRISGATKALLIAFAVIADGIQTLLLLLVFTLVLIPVSYALSLFLTLLVVSIYSAVFLGNGVNPFAGKRAIKKIATFAGTFILEMLPAIGEFAPSLTIWTYMTIRQSRHEDKEKAERDAKIEEEKVRKYQEMMRRRAEQEAQIAIQQQSAIARFSESQRENNVVPFARRQLPAKNAAPIRPQEKSSYQKAA